MSAASLTASSHAPLWKVGLKGRLNRSEPSLRPNIASARSRRREGQADPEAQRSSNVLRMLP